MKRFLQASIRWALLALVPLALGSCNKKMNLLKPANEAPTVRLTAAPVDTLGPDGQRVAYFYAYKLNWVGYDPDGRVDHFLYAIDKQKTPPGQPVAWTTTTKNEQTFFFKAGIPETDSTGKPLLTSRADDFHIFSIKAVDDRGAESPVVERAFFSFTQAPTVQIGEPQPSHLSWALVTPFVRISWTGQDPDGQLTQKPVKYKFKLFKKGNNEFDFDTILGNADSLRRYYAPTFAGWDSTGPDSAFALYSNLVPNTDYMFAVVAFDEAGAYSPIFSLDSNILWLRVTFAGQSGPVITVFNEFFNGSFSPGFPKTPAEKIQRTIFLEVPAYRQITFNWTATTSQGSSVKQYRWMLDNQNLDDETQRSSESADWFHWSQWSLGNTSATIGPFLGDTTHFFFLEAQDVNGLVSLGIIQMKVVAPPPENQRKDLLVVNDTRFVPDGFPFFPDPTHPDSIAPPVGSWPTRAELDTFLFARGANPQTGQRFRWRYTPDGTLSYPGLFGGYDYDTTYTMDLTHFNAVTLSELVKYRHVIWMADASGWNEANIPITGISALYVMSKPGASNTLAAYTTLGGQVWGLGGGFASAVMAPWNNKSDDTIYPAALRFGNIPYGGRPAELVPGRFMYDLPKWQSEIWCASSIGPVYKSLRLPADGSWTNPRYGVSCPAYSNLPDQLQQKNAVEGGLLYNGDGTSRYPFRDVSMLNYRAWPMEALPADNNRVLGLGIGANQITENISSNPDSQVFVSTLDTLLQCAGGTVFPGPNEDLSDPLNFNENVVMTYYHGFASTPFLFSGFDIWMPARPQLIQLVDFVLQDMWHMVRQPVDRNMGLPGTTMHAAHLQRR